MVVWEMPLYRTAPLQLYLMLQIGVWTHLKVEWKMVLEYLWDAFQLVERLLQQLPDCSTCRFFRFRIHNVKKRERYFRYANYYSLFQQYPNMSFANSWKHRTNFGNRSIHISSQRNRRFLISRIRDSGKLRTTLRSKIYATSKNWAPSRQWTSIRPSP